MKPHHLIALLSILFFALSGCSFGRMQTPHQLKHTEVIVDGAMDLPGAIFIPRLSLQGMVGLYDVMDISAHLGSSLFRTEAGVGMRFYPTSWFTLGLLGNYSYDILNDNDSFLSNGDDKTHISMRLRPTFSWYSRDKGGFYGGPQATLFMLSGVDYDAQSQQFTETGLSPELISLGIFFGYAYNFSASSVQFEFVAAPAFLDLTYGDALSPPETFPNINSVQLGISYVVFIKDMFAPDPKIAPPSSARPAPPRPARAPTAPAPAPSPEPPATPQPEPTPPVVTPEPAPTPEPSPEEP